MTLQPVRLDHFSVYFWMLGATLALYGIGATALGVDANAAGPVALGSLLMITALFVPILRAAVKSAQVLWQGYQANRGDEA